MEDQAQYFCLVFTSTKELILFCYARRLSVSSTRQSLLFDLEHQPGVGGGGVHFSEDTSVEPQSTETEEDSRKRPKAASAAATAAASPKKPRIKVWTVDAEPEMASEIDGKKTREQPRVVSVTKAEPAKAPVKKARRLTASELRRKLHRYNSETIPVRATVVSALTLLPYLAIGAMLSATASKLFSPAVSASLLVSIALVTNALRWVSRIAFHQ